MAMPMVLALVGYQGYSIFKFTRSKYRKESGNGYLRTVRDLGRSGEYRTFLKLEKVNKDKIILSEVYVPKKDGTTTEIDLIMIHETGIYVFESKNYSGWIYGSEKDKNWTQTLNRNSKYKFYNPIRQNAGHINALKDLLDIQEDWAYKSYIVFSERCELKKLNVTETPYLQILKRNELVKRIKKDLANSDKIFSSEDVEALYIYLKDYTLVEDGIKKRHIEDVKRYVS